MSFLKQKQNYYLLSLLAIVIKGSTLGVGFPEALIALGILAFESYGKYLDTIKVKDVSKELESRVSSLESKFSLVNSRRS
jgi:hypothetical protein